MSDLATAMQALASKHDLHGLMISLSILPDGSEFYTAYAHFGTGGCASGDNRTSPERAISSAIEKANQIRAAAPTIGVLKLGKVAA